MGSGNYPILYPAYSIAASCMDGHVSLLSGGYISMSSAHPDTPIHQLDIALARYPPASSSAILCYTWDILMWSGS